MKGSLCKGTSWTVKFRDWMHTLYGEFEEKGKTPGKIRHTKKNRKSG